jgi:(R,R)-butanediol dehydrogenase/meso-butanediol dehydrogenase/diacetyl reductase
MHAALITDQETIEFFELESSPPEKDQVVVDITLCGICGTDIHSFQSPGPAWPSTCGHEWTGVISAIGSDVTRVSEGDRVIIGVPPSCGSCSACHAGQMDKCQTVLTATVGRGPYQTPHGGFADQLTIHQGRVVLANPELSDEQAAQIEPAAICFHAVRANAPRLGDIAIVQGAGPIGLSTLQWVLAAGAGTTIVVEPNETRRDLALSLGAHHSIDPSIAADFDADHTRGLGGDIVYECAGVPATVQSAIDLARRGGRVSLIGLAMGDAPINPRQWLNKEIKVSAALGYTHEEFEMTMGFVSDGRIDLDALHSGTIDLVDIAETFIDLAGGQSQHTKVLVRP